MILNLTHCLILAFSEWNLINFGHYIFIISQLLLTSHPRSTMVLLDTGTPGTSREVYSEDADGETRTRNPSVYNQGVVSSSLTIGINFGADVHLKMPEIR